MTAGDCEPLWLSAGLSAPTTAWVEPPASSPQAPPGSPGAAEPARSTTASGLTAGQADRILQRIVAGLSAECVALRQEKQTRDRLVGQLLGAGLALHQALGATTHPYEPPGGDSTGCERLADPDQTDGPVCAELAGAAVHQTPDVVLGRDGNET